MNPKELALIYVWDAYCGWCYGFSKNIREFHENHPELSLTVLSGGLFVGNRRQPIGASPYIKESNDKISNLTGAVFGSPYHALLMDGNFIMDSEAAAIGFSALRSFAPDRAIYLASAMQRAFYQDAESLSDPATYREIARAYQLDPDSVLARMEDQSAMEDAFSDFAMARQLGVHSYPTLLLQLEDKYIRLGGGGMSTKEIEAQLQSAITKLG